MVCANNVCLHAIYVLGEFWCMVSTSVWPVLIYRQC